MFLSLNKKAGSTPAFHFTRNYYSSSVSISLLAIIAAEAEVTTVTIATTMQRKIMAAKNPNIRCSLLSR